MNYFSTYLFTVVVVVKLNLHLISFLFLNRQQSDCGREPEVDPWSSMDPHSPLLHLYARLGGRRRRRSQETDAQAEIARLDPEQSARPSHH